MNASTAMAEALVANILAENENIQNVELVVCPPFPYLAQVVARSAGQIAVGAQNLAKEQGFGAFTGEVSGLMLKELGCTYVIIGHSERRSYYAEDNHLVAQKVKTAIAAGLVPILCVGETLEEREANQTEAVVAMQLQAVTDVLTLDELAALVIAYEPVWAIGTGKTASPQQAEAVHLFIRNNLASISTDVAEKVRILYGGSMKPDNARELLAQPNIDGGLIGGASLHAEDFLAIAKAGEF